MLRFICLLVAFFPQEQPFYELYNEGLSAFKKKDYPEAIRLLNSAVALRPESRKSVKTYGVQFIEYYPYHYLVQAHIYEDNLQQAQAALDNAFRYDEDEDDKISATLDIIKHQLEQLRAQALASQQQEERPDLTMVLELLQGERHGEAQALIDRYLAQFPDEATLLLPLKKVADELVENQQQLIEAQAKITRRIQDLLGSARIAEGNEKLNEALSLYLATETLEPLQPEATLGIGRVREKMAAQGRSEEEIQTAIDQARQENERKDELLLGLTDEKNQLEAENLDLRQQLKRVEANQLQVELKVKFDWHVNPIDSPPLSAEINVFAESNVKLREAKLFINGFEFATYQQINDTHFQLPKNLTHTFPLRRNELVVKVSDFDGNQLEDSYQYTFPKPPQPMSPAAKRILISLFAGIVLVFFAMRIRRLRKAFRNRFNPYIAGAPVLNDDMFYGRQSLLTQILNTLHNNSIMIYGERRIGKTSFLHQLHATLPKIEDPHYSFSPVLVDLQGVKESQFFAVMDQEVASLMETKGMKVEPGSEDMDVRTFTRRLRGYINHLKKTSQRTPKLVLLLDEVDVMNGFSEHTNQQLRSVFMKGFAKYLVAVMAGIHINTTWKSEGSPWYNFFEQIELKPFSSDRASELITKPVQGIYQYHKGAIEEIINLTRGKPYLIQKICVNLIAHVLTENRRRITKADVTYVYNEIKREGWAVK